MKFKGKVDLWFWMIMLVGEAAVLAALLSAESRVIGIVVAIVYNIAFLPFVCRNYVEVTDDKITIVFGFGKNSISFSELTEVYSTHNPIASTAASFDRIVLKGTRGELMCAVKDKEGFFECLQERKPTLNIESDSKKHKKTQLEKRASAFTLLVFLLVGISLVTGNIRIKYNDTSFTIVASYWKDREVAYDSIEKIEYRDEEVSGSRVGGFGSFRLLMGNFENGEFGRYKNYTYTSSDSAVILWINGEELVIAGKDKESTHAIYEELLRRCQ